MNWISVKEGLSNLNNKVLIYLKEEKIVEKAYLSNIQDKKFDFLKHLVTTENLPSQFFVIYTGDNEFSIVDIEQVTHWMPLPKPPRE